MTLPGVKSPVPRRIPLQLCLGFLLSLFDTRLSSEDYLVIYDWHLEQLTKSAFFTLCNKAHYSENVADTPNSTKPSTPLLPTDKYSLAPHERWDLLTLVERFKHMQSETQERYGRFIEIRRLRKGETVNLSEALGDETFFPKCSDQKV